METEKIEKQAQSSKGSQFLFCVLGIYTCYWWSGYLQQRILKSPYKLSPSQNIQTFASPVSLIWIQSAIAWLLGWIINKQVLKSSTTIPSRKMLQCAILVTVSTMSSMSAIKITSFPVVMMIKSCSIIPVVMVGICCTSVQNHQLKLGKEKIIVAICISIGILLYNFGYLSQQSQSSTNIFGILLLFISLLADGFLPDVQAVIKSQYNPLPTEMFQQTNKYVTLFSLLYAVSTGELSYLLNFGQKCPQCIRDLIMFSILAAVGQIFVYRMVKHFKQHIVPFVITTRKIFTVVISIIVFHHSTTLVQVFGIVIVFGAACFEYWTEIFNTKKIVRIQTDVNSQISLSEEIQGKIQPRQSSKEKLQQIA